MASKKDRKVIKRDGMTSSGSEVHKMAELEACQRLLEAGCVGSRLYNGPHIGGSFFTRQDKLLSEIKWIAVDVFEQKKLAVAHGRLISSMVRKYWSERSRGSLSEAAGMVQCYWLSVAREIKAPVPHQDGSGGVLFQLNTLQGIRPAGSPRSMMPTPTNASNAFSQNSLGTPPQEEKKTLSHGQVHEWLDARETLRPPTAEGTTGMADFCVQIVKHHLREHAEGAVREEGTPRSRPSSPVHHQASTSDSSPSELPASSDFLIPLDPFMPNSYSIAQGLAVENAVQQNVAATRGVDGVRCVSAPFPASVRLEPESQKSVLTEMLVTNVMSRNPHLFGLASLAVSTDDHRRVRNRTEIEPPPPQAGQKHYFVSVIFSTSEHAKWEPVEDAILWDAGEGRDWGLVATWVNWSMRAWLLRDNLRTGPQCQTRWDEIRHVKHPKLQEPRAPAFLAIRRRRPVARRVQLSPLPDKPGAAPVVEVVPNPFFSQDSSAPPFDRRGVFALSRPARALFHASKNPTLAVSCRGAASESKAPLVSAWKVVSDLPLSTSLPHARLPAPGCLSLLEATRGEELSQLAVVSKVRPPPARAFALEEMLRKNPKANPGLVPQYISGQQVVACHPSFSNIPRIAEITLSRLVNSISDAAVVGGGGEQIVSIETLFGYCASFRKKYPSIFVSQQKSQKPFMPQLRPGYSNQAATNKMVTRQAAAARPNPPVAPVQQLMAPSSQPLPPPPPAPVIPPSPEPASAAAGPAMNWLRTSQRPRRVGSRGPGSPSAESAEQQSGDSRPRK